MAYTPTTLYKVSGGVAGGPQYWYYSNAADALGTVDNTDYFASAATNYGMRVGDILDYVLTSTGVRYPMSITAVDSDGNATATVAAIT